jgi:hypothetical protein
MNRFFRKSRRNRERRSLQHVSDLIDQWSGDGKLLNCRVPNRLPKNLSCSRGYQLNSNLAFRVDTSRMACAETIANNSARTFGEVAHSATLAVTSSDRAGSGVLRNGYHSVPVSAARWGRHAGGCRGPGGVRRYQHPGVGQVHRHALRACRCVRRGHHGRGRIDTGAAKLRDNRLYRAGRRVRRNLRR